MSSLIIILCIAGAAIAIFLFWRQSRPKYVAPDYPVIGMWDLSTTATKAYKPTPLGQFLWFKNQSEAHHAGDLQAAMDRAYNRIQNDMPEHWTQGRSPQDYMAAIVSETYPAASGAPSLKVTPVPPNLVGTKYDKGGFLLAGGATFLPPQFRPALMVIPNITSVEHIDAIENGFKHEQEHVCVFANNPDLHAYLAWWEIHPFLPLPEGTETKLAAKFAEMQSLMVNSVNPEWWKEVPPSQLLGEEFAKLSARERGEVSGIVQVPGKVSIDGFDADGEWVIHAVE